MPTPTLFADFRLRQLNGNAIDFTSSGPAIKVALLKSTWTPNTTTDTLFSGISSHEVTGSNYTAGGATIAGRTVALDGAVPEFVHDDVEWAQHASGFTDARYAAWYNSVSGRLIMVLDLGANRGNVNGPFKLDVDPASGVLNG